MNQWFRQTRKQHFYDRWQGVFGDVTDRTSGDARNGHYEIDVTVPAGAEPGIWTVSVRMRDVAGRIVTFGNQPWHQPLPVGSSNSLEIVRSNALP